MRSTSVLIRIIIFMVLLDLICSFRQSLVHPRAEWSRWSACSRSCGSGISLRQRSCSPHRPKCKNFEARVCNTQECKDGQRTFLTEQCSKYDGKILAGMSYNWVPFFTDKDECLLNCRAVGYRFYAKLGRVEDGTPCRSYRPTMHICIAAKCIEVGCDGVVGSGKEVDWCGVCGGRGLSCRQVAGLYTTPRLPHGFNFVLELPVNATNITISQLKKDTRNHLALKKTDGEYVLNGKSGVMPSGEYEAGGAVFLYQNSLHHKGEYLKAKGPLAIPLHLMLIYEEPNSGIKYEYTIPVAEAEVESNSPILLADHSKPPLRYIEVHSMNPEASNASIKENTIVFARHGKAAYVTSPAREGTKILGDEESRTKRQKRKRFIWKISGYSACSKSCGGGSQQAIRVCVRGSNEVVVPDRRCTPSPLPLHKCNLHPCPPRWEVGEWTSCSGSCGAGLQYREVECLLPEGEMTSSRCPLPAPDSSRSCTGPPCPSTSWRHGSWSPCSSLCGWGVRRRSVVCPGSGCSPNQRPLDTEECNMGPCTNHSYWLYSDWNHKCSEECGIGVERRRVVCLGDGHCEENKKPEDSRSCYRNCMGEWLTGPWQTCSGVCGAGEQTRTVLCVAHVNGVSIVTEEKNCLKDKKPAHSQRCELPPCQPAWFMSEWRQCSKACDSGIQRREVKCLNEKFGGSLDCKEAEKPFSHRSCNTQPCNVNPDKCVDTLDNCYHVVQSRLCLFDHYYRLCCYSCQKKL